MFDLKLTYKSVTSLRSNHAGNMTPAAGAGCSTPTTPSTPLTAPGDIMSQLATLTKFEGMISYVSHACSIGSKSGEFSGCVKFFVCWWNVHYAYSR